MNPKQLRRFIRSQGFILVSEKRHYKYKHVETGGYLIVAKTPSDTNHHKQVLRDMKRLKKGTRPCDRK